MDDFRSVQDGAGRLAAEVTFGRDFPREHRVPLAIAIAQVVAQVLADIRARQA